MKHSVFMAIAAILALLVGLALALIPAPLLSVYGITLEPDGEWIARCAFLDWRSRISNTIDHDI